MYRSIYTHPSRVWRNTSDNSLLHGIIRLGLGLFLSPPSPPSRRRRQPWPAAGAPLLLSSPTTLCCCQAGRRTLCSRRRRLGGRCRSWRRCLALCRRRPRAARPWRRRRRRRGRGSWRRRRSRVVRPRDGARRCAARRRRSPRAADRKSTRLNFSHKSQSRMPSSA